jgi:nucleotide-binding universal stress UspA family protein
MAIKDILICVEPDEKADVATLYGLSLAGLCGAHATGTSIVYDMPVGIYASEVPQDYIERMIEQTRKATAKAASRFDDAARIAGISHETVTLSGGDGNTAYGIAELARHFDLAVMSQPRAESNYSSDVIETVLFSSGRPVLVVPFIQRRRVSLDRVLVAWDRSEVAAKAVAAALPVLEMAQAVQVVSVQDPRAPDSDLPGFNIARHLARHGVNAEVKIVPNTAGIGDVLLSHAADENIDLIVMGAYGHSRFREFVLGGTTRTILETMTVPVLFAH